MTTKDFIVGNSYSQQKIVKYSNEQAAKDDATVYHIISASDWKDAREIFREMYTTEPENRDL